MDFVAAYLQGEFAPGEVVYYHMPPGHEQKDDAGKPCICKIVKPVYGIPQSGRRLQRRVFPWLESTGLRQLDESDNCVWTFDDPTGKETFTVGIYVDNMQIVHSVNIDADGNAVDPDSFLAQFLKQLRADWDIVDEGEMEDLLGIQVRRNSNGSITLHQSKYIDKLFEHFQPASSNKTQRNSLPFSSYIQERVIDALATSTASCPAYPDLVKPFQERLGSLMYSSGSCRPDVSYSVHLLARCMSRPTPDLMKKCDFVLNYLKATRDLGITYSPGSYDLEGFSDVSWEVRYSTSGWTILWQRGAIAWGSRKEQSVSLSSCESEIITLSKAAKDVIFYRKLLKGLDVSYVSEPTRLYTDNRGARDLSYNPEHHDKTKHIKRRHVFVRDQVKGLEIAVPYVATAANIADFLTKPLNATAFKKLRAVAMNEPAAHA